jgi:hypothetical protein
MSEHLLGTRGLHVCSHIVRVGRWTAAQKRMHLEARRHNMERWKRWRGVDAEDAPRGRPPTPTDSPHNCSNIKVRVRPVRRAQGAWPPPLGARPTSQYTGPAAAACDWCLRHRGLRGAGRPPVISGSVRPSYARMRTRMKLDPTCHRRPP